MLFFKSKMARMKLDTFKYTKTLDRVMGEIIREAAREWLRAVITFAPSRDGFPVRTGMAKSTLKPLGRFLRVAVPVSPQEGDPDRRSQGEAASKFSIRSSNYRYEFNWSNSVLHYYLHEYGLAPHKDPAGPWQSIKHGEDAMLRYIKEALNRRLPKIAQYISFTAER